MRIRTQGLGPRFTMTAKRMSVILRVDGLEARLTFLISGSASAPCPTAAPPSNAREDLRTLRRLKRNPFGSDILVHSFARRILLSNITPASADLCRRAVAGRP